MNIFEQYLDKIKKTLLDFSKKGDLILPDSLDGITAEIPPSKFNSDISTNVAMVLSKINKKPPIELANTLSEKIKKNDQLIDEISVVKPGFINIKLKPVFWTNFINQIIQNSKSFGINTKEKKNNYLNFSFVYMFLLKHYGNSGYIYLPTTYYMYSFIYCSYFKNIKFY